MRVCEVSEARHKPIELPAKGRCEEKKNSLYACRKHDDSERAREKSLEEKRSTSIDYCCAGWKLVEKGNGNIACELSYKISHFFSSLLLSRFVIQPKIRRSSSLQIHACSSISMRTFSKHIYEIDANPAHGNRISNTLTYVQNVFQDNFLYYYFFRSSRLLGRSFARSIRWSSRIQSIW